MSKGPKRASTSRPCGHARHVGSCPCCQRAQLERWEAQLRAVSTQPPRPCDTWPATLATVTPLPLPRRGGPTMRPAA